MKELSLQKQLADWNRQESRFKELFSEEALRDKEFQKMKLREYDKLWHLHKGTAQTTDERALLNMLRFQRRKMTRRLYPGLLRRLLHKVVARIAAGREKRRMQQMEVREHLDRYTRSSLPGIDPDKRQQSQQQALQKPLRKVYGPHLGRKPSQKAGQRKGLSI